MDNRSREALKMDNRSREALVKESLTNELKSRLDDVLLGRTEESGSYITNEEAGVSLCTVLEAIFVHGVKESLSEKMSVALGIPDRKPTPEFWSPMLVFTHRQTIEQISNFKQIITDVGRSRTWIRLALNDGLFLSYLQTILNQNKALYRYYKRTAYLRDVETLNIAINVLQSVAKFTFSFPVNSSILNEWPNTPLLLAGLWTPPMKYCPIATGMDLARNLPNSAERDTDAAMDLLAYDIMPNPQKLLLNDEEALKLILNTPIEGSPLQSRLRRENETIVTENSLSSETSIDLKRSEEIEIDQSESLEINLESSYLEMSPGTSDDIPLNAQIDMERNAEQPITPTLESYETILENYHSSTSPINQEPSINDFLSNYEPSSKTENQEELTHNDEMGFEIVQKSVLPTSKQEFKKLFFILSNGEIMQEVGLDSQQFSCRQCGTVVGLNSKKPRVCNFTGCYYCEECFVGVDMMIPARILHNWDFTKYSVSLTASSFLLDVTDHPLLNVRKINPRIYFAVEDMDVIQKLRIKLNLLRPYLFTCHNPIRNHIKKLFWPREYIYEHVHLFSLTDLAEIKVGTLIPTLRKMVHLSVEHVKSCELCFQKGFICELCKSPSSKPIPIFPFEDSSYRCQLCCNVYHLQCYQIDQTCPKCARIKERKAKLERLTSEES